MKTFFSRYLLNPLRGSIVIVILFLNVFFFPFLLFLLSPIVFLMPTKKLHAQAFRALNILPKMWRSVNNAALHLSFWGRLHVHAKGEIDAKKWYVLISNHQCWADILMIDLVMNGLAPAPRFFMKKSLLWQLPILSWVCWILGYPFLERRNKAKMDKLKAAGKEKTQDDIERTRIACQKFKIMPTMPVIYAEGTRFTQKKHDRQQSPFQYLLKPKAGGVAVVLSELRSELAGIIDLTINYSDENPSIWRVLSGGVKRVDIDYRVLPITQELMGDYASDREYRPVFQKWLNGVWLEKDALLSQLKKKVLHETGD